MKHYLQTLALATLLLSSAVVRAHTSHSAQADSLTDTVEKANSTENAVKVTAGVTLLPRYIRSDHETSAVLPLVGVPPVPEQGWLYSGSTVYTDVVWQPLNPLLGVPVDKVQAYAGVSWSDVENKLVPDHVLLEATRGAASAKIGRFPPFAQPKNMGVSSLLLANLIADDHWHVDGVQANYHMPLTRSEHNGQRKDNVKLTLGAYAEGAYLGDSAEGDNGMGPVATAHVGVAWHHDGTDEYRINAPKQQTSNQTSKQTRYGAGVQLLHSPDAVRIARLDTHTHGSVLEECSLDKTSCYDGQQTLAWLTGFWEQNVPSSGATYGVDAILAAQDMRGKLNTAISSVDYASAQWQALVDMYYKPARPAGRQATYRVRAEGMQMQHDLSGLRAEQTAKDLNLFENNDNPWRIGVQVSQQLSPSMTLSPAVFWDNTRAESDVIYSLGMTFQYGARIY